MKKLLPPDFSVADGRWKFVRTKGLYVDTDSGEIVVIDDAVDDPRKQKNSFLAMRFGTSIFYHNQDGKSAGKELSIFEEGVYIKTWGLLNDEDNWCNAVLADTGKKKGWLLLEAGEKIQFEFDYAEDLSAVSAISIFIEKDEQACLVNRVVRKAKKK